ncbi:MAG: hypothetical protein WAN48_05355 [Actinomycetes bacterium]
MAHYIFNFMAGNAARKSALREQAAELVRVRMWGVKEGETHRSALAPLDPVLIYVGAPVREFIGRAELASVVHDWTTSEARVYPGSSRGGVLLAQVEEWDPPVPMGTVLSQLDRAGGARADFEVGVVRITASEFETALAVAAGRAASTGCSGRLRGAGRSWQPIPPGRCCRDANADVSAGGREQPLARLRCRKHSIVTGVPRTWHSDQCEVGQP